MIGKIIAGSSFGATVGYVMKEQSRILSFEGIEPPNVQDMVRDFKDQTLLNPRIKNAVGHISLSFSVKDADKLTDPIMAQIAREYMERMGIRNTQFLIVRHTDQAHPHCQRAGTARTVARAGQDQVRHLRCRTGLSAPMQVVGRSGGAIAEARYYDHIQVLRRYRPQTGCAVLQERLHLFRLEDRPGFQLLQVRPSLLTGAADRSARRTALLFGAGGREFIGCS